MYQLTKYPSHQIVFIQNQTWLTSNSIGKYKTVHIGLNKMTCKMTKIPIPIITDGRHLAQEIYFNSKRKCIALVIIIWKALQNHVYIQLDKWMVLCI